MSWLWPVYLAPGDWVRARQPVARGWADHLTGEGLPEGTVGVVVDRFGSRLVVDFDTGYGLTRASVCAGHCALVRKGGGSTKFRERAKFMTTVRLSLVAFFTFPCLWYAVQYWWQERTFDGLVESMIMASLDAAWGFLVAAINDPVRAVIYLVVMAVLGRIAFPHHRPLWRK